MDTIMNDVERLFVMAAKADGAPPLDTRDVMRRIAGAAPAAPADESFLPPLRFCIGIGSVAAALAVIVAGLAAGAWTELHDPLQIVRPLPDILGFLSIQ